MNPENKAIDIDFLRSVIDNDREFEKELFAIFSENAKRNIVKMEEAINKTDNNAWYMASHAFKGAAASIGAFELSKTLEYAQKHPEDNAEEKNKTLQQVRDNFTLVLDFITEELAAD